MKGKTRLEEKICKEHSTDSNLGQSGVTEEAWYEVNT